MIRSLILFAVYFLVSALGLYKIKLSHSYSDNDFIIGFILYGAGFLIWMTILKSYPLSFAFPVAAGGLIIASQIVGYTLLHEPMKNTQLAGSGLIIGGIILLYLNQKI